VTVTVATVPSMSVPPSATAMSVSSLPDEVEAVAVGRSLTSTTVITSLAGALVPPSLSVTVNAIVTVPLKLAAGVKMNDWRPARR
jgi:hypothetical protein